MSLFTLENVGNRAGWKVTALGRMIRPARMRPMRLLVDLVESTKIGKINGIVKMKRKSLTRMREKMIDPIHWGSIYLKGVFLDAERVPNAREQDNKHRSYDEDGDVIADTNIHGPAETLPSAFLSPTDMALEKERSMASLQSLARNSEHNEWGDDDDAAHTV